MTSLRSLSAALCVLVGCAGQRGADPASAPTTETRLPAAQQAGSAEVRWTGNFQPVQIRSSSPNMRVQSRIYGTVDLSALPNNPKRTRARLNFTSQSTGNSFTGQWALLPGRCGTGSLPVTGIENFPVIEVSSNGRASLDSELALALPESGEYHVNVYLGGQQLDNVITCANLKR
jgi:hypothetical protein